MKPIWDDLGEMYENSKKVLIGDVDCTKDINKQLCEDHGVKGYPTLKYYNPGDREGESYEGERTLDAFKTFVKTLGPPCGPKHLKKCTETQKASLEKYMAMSADEVNALLTSETGIIADAQKAHDDLLKSLQAQFEESNKNIEALKKEKQPEIKMMKAALTGLTAAKEEPAVAEAKSEL